MSANHEFMKKIEAENCFKTSIDLSTDGESFPKIKNKVTFPNNPIKVIQIAFNNAFPIDITTCKVCPQGCPFCFNTLNAKANKSTVGNTENTSQIVIKQIQKAHGPGYNPENFLETCIRNRYPMVFSNNIDPMLPALEEQYKSTSKILEACLEHKQPLRIQTKEVYWGERQRELLIAGKDIFSMYVSISSLDYDKAKKFETVAVTPKQRLKRIYDLSKNGVKTCVALNPYIPELVPNLKEFFQAVKDCGAVGVYTHPLNFSDKQRKVLPDSYVYKNLPNRHDDWYDTLPLMRKLCDDLGLKLHAHQTPYWSDPDFVNGWCLDSEQTFDFNTIFFHNTVAEVFEEEKKPIEIYWEDYDKFYNNLNPKMWNQVFRIDELGRILCTTNDKIDRVNSQLGKKNTLRNIVKYMWNNPDESQNLLFYYFGYRIQVEVDAETDDFTPQVDEEGNLIYVFDGDYRNGGTIYDISDATNADALIQLEIE
ncbi:MAG: hypothetical protein ACXVCY_04560 [Pseudobdellovibrionaceae bacterium]